MNMLIVEDHPIVANATKSLFLAMGIQQVEICKTADEAIAKLQNGDWFRIWLDINLPGAYGLSLIRHVAEIGLAARSAVITATDNAQWRNEVKSLGLLGYVLKTASVEEFNHAIEKIINGDYCHENPSLENKQIRLTPRQLQILDLVHRGLPTKRIAMELNISIGAVDNHMSNVISVLNAKDRTNAVVLGMQYGYIGQNPAPYV